MKITRIDCFRVFVPWQASYREAMADWRARMNTTPEEEDSYVLVRVHTDEGLTGLGEGDRDLGVIQREASSYVGRNPLELMPWKLGRPWAHAFFDLQGKALGVPFHRLIGTPVHDRVPMAYWSPYETPHKTAKHAEEGARRGFKVHKIKARPWDAVDQVKAMTAAAGPDYAIRIDPNCTFEQPSVAIRIARQVEGYRVECLEDPVTQDRVEWNRLIREKTTVPVALHSSQPQNVWRHLTAGAIDYLNVGGSLETLFRAAHLAEAAGVPVWLQIEGHCYDIQAAFNVHVNAVIPNAVLPQDTLPFLREASIVTEPLWPTDGFVKVPEKPGLGVDLDENAAERYRVG
ncbi:MAG: hypothetical protein HYU36_03900 [Planctomycetes bacterium]|nr:hypothetical protein [Planctomycetota bacterium]